jgi:prevent-host-death family protein
MPKLQEWQLQEAKSRLSKLVRQASAQPQVITLHGKPVVAVVAIEEYRRLAQPKVRLTDVMRTAPKGFGEVSLERDQDTALREVAL